VRALVAAAVVSLNAGPAFAQGAWVDRARVSFSVGSQADTTLAAQSMSLLKYAEPAPLTTGLKGWAPFVDAGVAVRFARHLGVGLAVSYASANGDAEVNADIPHPFQFEQPRAIRGLASGVTHRELVAHADLVYVLAFRRMDLAVSGGASIFRVGQDLVSKISVDEVYPYDTASFSSATLTGVTEWRAGYNGGVDLTWKVTPRWGVGGLLRFTRASVPFELDGLEAGTATVGGFQIGAGVRFVIPSRRPQGANQARPPA
jgi:hypothetical protein